MEIDIQHYSGKKLRNEMNIRGISSAKMCKLLKDTFNLDISGVKGR